MDSLHLFHQGEGQQAHPEGIGASFDGRDGSRTSGIPGCKECSTGTHHGLRKSIGHLPYLLQAMEALHDDETVVCSRSTNTICVENEESER